MQNFASDNNAGMCPEALAALVAANAAGHVLSYGDDPWTRRAAERIDTVFERPCRTFFVFNGTAANALSLAALARPYNAVIAHAFSHIETDEASAPEFFTGGAKLTPDAVARLATRYSGFHHVKPAVLSITQATELGTVYSVAEVTALTDAARAHGLRVHMDGARLANAVAHLGCRPADITWRAGVDVLAFGGSKNGLGLGEAVVFFTPALADEFEWRVKQSGQLASKMRFMSAPWAAALEADVWLRHARHANAMAARLAAGLATVPGIRLMAPVEANAVFAEMPPALQAALRAKGWRFYTFVGETGCRLMCAWDTSPDIVDRFLADATGRPASARL